MKLAASILLIFLVWFIMTTVAAAFLFYFFLVRPGRPKRETSRRLFFFHSAAAKTPAAAFREQIEQRRLWLLRQPLERVEITSRDGLKLRALFWPADQPTGKAVLCIHGYRNNGAREYGVYAKFYHDRGYHLLIPDDRAHGGSEGRYIGFGYLDRLDCLDWCRYLDDRLGDDCAILLHGISMGCATVIMASGEEALSASVRGVIADCGYTSALDEFGHQLKTLFHLPRFPILYLASGICRIFAGYTFRQCDTLAFVKKASVPFLFIHGGADNFVPTRMGYELFAACPAKKDLLIVPGAKHAKSYLCDPVAWERAAGGLLERIGF